MSKETTAKVAENAAVKATAANTDEFKARKAEAAKKFNERQKADKQERIENAGKLKEQLMKLGSWEKLDEKMRTWIEKMAAGIIGNNGGAVNSGTFGLLFGDNPKVGDKITLEDVFKKTFKGKQTIDIAVRKWKEKGIIVDFVHNNDMAKSTYVIKALPGKAQ